MGREEKGELQPEGKDTSDPPELTKKKGPNNWGLKTIPTRGWKGKSRRADRRGGGHGQVGKLSVRKKKRGNAADPKENITSGAREEN